MDLDTLFKANNWAPKGAESADDNPLYALTRPEWLECVLRLANAKFGRGRDTPPAAAVDALVCAIV